MSRSFGLVDEKTFEADFFLEKLSKAGLDMFAARCYFSAFVAAARSITLALQAVMQDTNGFDEWYKEQQETLTEDEIAKFFVRTRNEIQHVGLTPLNSGCCWHDDHGQLKVQYQFSKDFDQPAPGAPDIDVVSTCSYYLTSLIQVVYDCYREFGPTIDPDQYYTLENLRGLGLTIEDVEEELGLPRGWTFVESGTDQDRIEALRRSAPRTEIDTMFEKYLGKTRFLDDEDRDI